MLDAFAVELHQVLFNLPTTLARLFIERDADFAVGCRQCLGREAGVLPLDVKKTYLAKVEQPGIKIGPERHAAPVDVVCEVVNQRQAVAHRVPVHPIDKFKVNVIDGLTVFKAVNQVQGRPANALDGGQVQLHRAGTHFHGLGTKFKRPAVGMVRVSDTKGHAARTRPMLGGKVARHAFGFAVDNEINAALTVQHHIFGTVPCHQREAHALKNRLNQACNR